MDHLRVDYSRILTLDVAARGRPLSGRPPRSPVGSTEASIVRTALSAAPGATARLASDVAQLSDSARRLAIAIRGGSSALVSAPPSLTTVTIGLGGSTSAFAAFGVTAGAGLYGSTTPELGWYLSGGAGYWTNAGVSAGLALTYVFGPPSAFSGLSIGVGVDADLPGLGVGISILLLFGASGPPFQFLGYSLGVSAGVSLLPMDFTIQASDTYTRKIL